jgi:hypothetical protein
MNSGNANPPPAVTALSVEIIFFNPQSGMLLQSSLYQYGIARRDYVALHSGNRLAAHFAAQSQIDWLTATPIKRSPQP